MSYLVDTNVISEAVRPSPSLAVIDWLKAHEHEIMISSLTIGEICRGVMRLPKGKRRLKLEQWLEELRKVMRGRILSFAEADALIWGELLANLEKNGVGIATLDSQIAAIAQRHGLILVTRNDKHFAHCGVELINPFARS